VIPARKFIKTIILILTETIILILTALKNKAKNKVEYESKEKHYSNVEFFNNIWNGSGESYVIGKGWTVLYGGGFKFKRRKDGNWYRVKKNLK